MHLKEASNLHIEMNSNGPLEFWMPVFIVKHKKEEWEFLNFHELHQMWKATINLLG